MKLTRLRRFHIWLDARADARRNLPAANSEALGPSEQRIQAAVNLSVRSLQDAYAKASEPLKAQLRAALEQLNDVEWPEWEAAVERTARRQEDVVLGNTSHRLIMTVLTVGEAGYNAMAFAVTGDATVFSVGMSLAVTVATPLLAFHSGVAARQYQPTSRKLAWVVGLSVVAMTTLFVINQMRIAFLNAQHTGDGNASWFISPLGYFLINMGVYVAAAVVTYLAKDPDSAFVKAKARVERRKAEIARLRGQLNELAARLVHQARILHEAGHQMIAYYRLHNRRRRKDAPPEYFDNDRHRNHVVPFAEVQFERFDDEPQMIFVRRAPASIDAPTFAVAPRKEAIR